MGGMSCRIGEEIFGTMQSLFAEATKRLCSYLEEVLDTDEPDWWTKQVYPCLSFQQQRIVKEKKISSLARLDLSCLLRVLDQNWHFISQRRELSSEARHYVKEMQSVRNRWAHVGSLTVPADDVYRDLDTLERFVAVVGAEEGQIDAIRAVKRQVFETGEARRQEAEAASEPETEFHVGEIVCLKADPSVAGAVVSVTQAETENRYGVFCSGEVHTYYASQLLAQKKPEAPLQDTPLKEFQAHLTARGILHPSTASLYSLNAARIDFVPYQFRPVFKFIRSDRPRLLIADGLGVGKTIEAGLIIRELEARRDIRSILILCPRPLVTERKWELEMKRFDEKFTCLDGPALRYCLEETDLDGVWPQQHAKTIIPFSLLDERLLYGESAGRRRRKGLLDLDPPPRFDLVIVDEAHHARNPGTFVHRCVRFFCENSDAALFLTATPIQLGSSDLFVLLNLLRPDLVVDEASFEQMAGPNPHINQTIDFLRSQTSGWRERAKEAMRKAAQTPWGRTMLQNNPEFQRVFDSLGQEKISPEEKIANITALERMHTFDSLINRTRRRDIGEFTVRKAETVKVDFTPAQRRLHDEILEVQASILERLHGDQGIGFMMTTIRRQAASCLPGLIPFLEEILTRRLDELALEEIDEELAPVDVSTIDSIRGDVARILEQAKRLPPEDPKLEALRQIIRDKQKLPNNKIMIFSSFRHTLAYLFERLRRDGRRVGLIHGDVPDAERLELRRKFSLPREAEDALDILLFSEVGCEGLDYQFCDCIVNYDLHWNPMRIDQRIGRIDRRGQKSPTVAIYNLITPDVIDEAIYSRCLLRIGVFERALGGCEEILGQLTKEVRDVAENLSLTEEERRARLQQITDNKIRLIQEQEALEEKQLELFGVRLARRQVEEEIEKADSFWFRAAALQNLVESYLRDLAHTEQTFIKGKGPLKTLQLSRSLRDCLLQDLSALSAPPSAARLEWERWLKGASPRLTVTFDAACAAEHREAAFLIPTHPLVRQAARHFIGRPGQPLFTSFVVRTDIAPPGEYAFRIYEWRYSGLQSDQSLQAVCAADITSEEFLALLENAQEDAPSEPRVPSEEDLERLEKKHHALWSAARREHVERNAQMAAYKKESLTASHRARIALLEDQLKLVSDEKIQRMRRSEMESAQADYERRMKQIDDALAKADIFAQSAAFGVMRVLPQET